MAKFKVGDIVKPNDNMSAHPLGYLVLARMLEGKVVSVGDQNVDVLITKAKAGLEKHKGDKIGYFSEERFDLVYRKQELHVTADGTTTHAVLEEGGKVVKRAKAVCSPEDEYSFETGARLAIDRVFGKDEKNAEEKGAAYEPKFKFEIGDVVKVVDGGETYSLYDEFMKQYGDDYLMRWGYGSEPDEMFAYKVVQRGIGLGNTLYVIERQGECGKPLYIISEDGLKKAW